MRATFIAGALRPDRLTRATTQAGKIEPGHARSGAGDPATLSERSAAAMPLDLRQSGA